MSRGMSRLVSIFDRCSLAENFGSFFALLGVGLLAAGGVG